MFRLNFRFPLSCLDLPQALLSKPLRKKKEATATKLAAHEVIDTNARAEIEVRTGLFFTYADVY